MFATKEKITVLKEISDYIAPLTEEEFAQLENNLIDQGCRDPLIVWQRDNAHLVLIDGHNRFKICQKHDIPFKTKRLEFSNLDDVKIWMVDNQMGRRNLSPDQLSYYRGLKYLTLKKSKGGYDNVKSKGKKELQTAEVLAEKFNVSESTVKRDSKFAEGLNIIGRSNPKLKLKILSGDIKVKKADVQSLTDAKHPDKIVIKNEADLYNKAKNIRSEILDEVERRVRQIRDERINSARKIIQESEPLFLQKDDRIRKIKGMIISAINKAINDRDVQAIKELKKLIDKLAETLFE